MQNPTSSFTVSSHEGVTPVTEIVSEISHTTLTPKMPRTSRESRHFNATRSKGHDGFYELQLESGRVGNPSATSLDPIQQTSDPSLPPCDGGLQAWLFLGSAFMIEALLWGLPATFGIFNAFYKAHPNFRDSPYVPIIGALSTSIPFLGAPIITPLVSKYRQYQRQMVWTGVGICVVSLILASFATKIWALIVTQGALFGIGVLVLYYAILSMLDEWFVRRRGFAYGILFGAAGFAGMGLPFMFQALLETFDYAITLRVYALIIVVFVGAPLPLCRGRYLYTNCKPNAKIEWPTLRTPVFLMFSLANLLQGIAFFLPGFYLPVFAGMLNISSVNSTVLLGALNFSQVVSQCIVGQASDKLNVFALVATSSLASGFLVIIWLFARSFTPLLIFSLLFGLFAGGYSVLWPRFISTLTKDPTTSLFLYGWLAAGRGAGNLIAVPISVAIMDRSAQDRITPTFSYRGMIIFASAALLVSGLISTSSCGIGWLRNRKQKSLSPSTLSSSFPISS